MIRKPRPGLGLILILVSGLALFYNYAWATLSGGPFQEGSVEWWRAVLGSMFATPENAVWSLGAVAGLIFGIWLCWHAIWRNLRPGPRSPEGLTEQTFD